MIMVPFLASATNTSTKTNPWCGLWLTVIILLSPSLLLWSSLSSVLLLVNAYQCSRCDSSESVPIFPAFTCLVPLNIDEDDPNKNDYDTDPFYQGFLTGDCLPQDKFPCICPEAESIPIKEFRFPFVCDYYGLVNPGALSTFGSCACSPEYSQNICVSGKCDYAFQCDDEIYVCWDGISPQDLGLDDDTCDNNELTAVKYCKDSLDHPFFNGGYECTHVPVCDWDQDLVGFWVDQFDSCYPGPSKTPDDLLRNDDYICPNGKQITRIIEFCSPSDVDPPFNNCDGNEIQPCNLNFCDFGPEKKWKLTKTTSQVTSMTCPENIEQNDVRLFDLGAIISYEPVIANSLDTCRNGEQIQSKGIASGEFFPFGTTTNTFTDANGEVSCSFTVTIIPAIVTSLFEALHSMFDFLFK